jgi:V8-like Glu-specific endopeptidase
VTPTNNTVRVFNSHAVVGAGVFVGYDQVVTNAHVINSALRRDKYASDNPKESVVELDFPFLAYKRVSARVVRWLRPKRGDVFKGDIATLRLNDAPPDGVVTQKLLEVETRKFEEAQVLVYGFPANVPTGVWADGILRGSVGGGRVQIDDSMGHGYFVTDGFSGAPVWDKTKHRILGIVSVADRDGGVSAFFMIPAGQLSERLSFEQPQRGNASWKLEFFRSNAMTALLDDLSDREDDGLEPPECGIIVRSLDKIANAMSDFEEIAFWDIPLHQDIEKFQAIYRNWNGYERGQAGASERREALKRLRDQRRKLSDRLRAFRGVVNQPAFYTQADENMFDRIFSTFEQVASEYPDKFRNIRGQLLEYKKKSAVSGQHLAS